MNFLRKKKDRFFNGEFYIINHWIFSHSDQENKKEEMGIKEELDKLYNVTDEDIDQIILGQVIEDEEEKLKILKEIREYKSFEDYVKNHEKDFDTVDITDDFKMIFISSKDYPNIHLDLLKKIGIIADHYGIFIYIEPSVGEKIVNKE